MTDEEKPKRGRPRKAEGETLSERTGGFYLSKLEREGLDWMIAQDDAQARRFSGRVTESSLLRGLVQAELIRRRWDRAHLLPQAAVAPEPPSVSPPPVEAPPVAAAPPEPEPPPSAPPVVAAVEEPPTKPRAPTPATVRKLMERAYSAGLSREELSERSGVDKGKLSHFRSDSDRGKLSPEKLSALDAALRRWTEEQGR